MPESLMPGLRWLKNLLDRNRLLPSYSEDGIFLIALSVVIVLLIDDSALAFAKYVATVSKKAIVISILGMAFAVYTAFFAYFKNELQKHYMFWFAVLINGLSAVATIQIIWAQGLSAYYYAAPGFNALIVLLMMVLWWADLLDTSTLPYKAASYSNIIFGGCAVVLVAVLSKYVFELYWPAILSMSVGYATVFNKKVTHYLPKVFAGRDSQIEQIDRLLSTLIDKQIEQFEKGNVSALCIGTARGVKIVSIPHEFHENNLEFFIGEQIRQLNRDEQVVAVSSGGTFEMKRNWLSKIKIIENAVIVDVFTNKHSKGYRFYQVIKIGRDATKISKHRGLIYLNRIKNIFV